MSGAPALVYSNDMQEKLPVRIEGTVIAPPDRTPFIGRRSEFAALLAEIEGDARLLTIIGPSGMGKTRLSRQVLAAETADHFRAAGGAWFCEVEACRTEADLQMAVARTLGISQQQGPLLARAIANRGPTLLVLDNLDEVARQASSILGEWVDSCPELQILVTSIVPSGMEGEICFELGPLDANDAIALYLETARRAWADREFGDADTLAVEELVGRLDRIPLAIELAAARVRVLPPRALLDRIGERFELLQTSRPGRHGSLLRALSLTWELLSDREQRLLAHTSIFVGGFSLDAAIAVLGEGESANVVVELLDGLRAKALIQLDASAPSRFSLYESVREFAGLQLQKSGDEERAFRRHADHFSSHGARHADEFEGRNPLPAIRWLKAERENLLAAHHRMFDLDPLISTRAGLALLVVLELDGLSVSESGLLDSIVRAARAAGDPTQLLSALGRRATAFRRHGRLDDARAEVDGALALAVASSARLLQGHLLVESAAIGLMTGEIARAVSELEAAILLGHDEGDVLIEGSALRLLGVAEEMRGSLEESFRYCERALALFRSTGLPRYESQALIDLGTALARQTRFREARQAYQEALPILQRLESVGAEADLLVNLGGIEMAAGRLDEAERLTVSGLEQERRLGQRTFEAVALGNLGIIYLERGEPSLAEPSLLEAISIFDGWGETRNLAELLTFLAVSQSMQGRLEEARTNFADARELFEKDGNRSGLDTWELLRAFLDLAEARAPGAEASALEARARARLQAASSSGKTMTDGRIVGVRLLEKELSRSASSPREPRPSLVVGPDADWFVLCGPERIDLRRRTALRRILLSLARQRRDAPGAGMSQQELFECGWVGEKALAESAALRVYNAIRTLRSLGLSAALLRHDSGYLLDPELPLILQEGDEPSHQR